MNIMNSNPNNDNRMKKSVLMFLLSGAVIFTACNGGKMTPQEEALKQANDSLRQANAEMHNYYEEMINFITEIDADMQSIKSAENYVIEQHNDTGDITLSAQTRIKEDIELMSLTLNRNRERIAELERRLKSSSSNSAALQRSVELLKAQIAEKDSLIVSLQESLAARDVRIQELDVVVDKLTVKVKDLDVMRKNQQTVIDTQDAALNEVYYVYAYTDQLRENYILTGGGLFSKTEVLKGDFNQDFFVKADKRKLKTIFLESKKVKVCTNHAAGSYELVQDEEGFYSLNILDIDKFWALSPYLVVELK